MKASLFLLCILKVVVLSMGGEENFIAITILNRSPQDLVIAESHLPWGKHSKHSNTW